MFWIPRLLASLLSRSEFFCSAVSEASCACGLRVTGWVRVGVYP